MPDAKWLEEIKKYGDKLASPVDLNEYFEKDELYGVQLAVYPCGTLSVPTGELIGCDPLVCLDDRVESYYIKVPTGEYPAELCIVKSHEGDCDRNAAMRVRFNGNRAVRFELALTGSESIEEIAGLEEGEYFGFPVDAGLGCICDRAVQKAYTAFETEQFEKHGSDFNMYDDFMAALFDESYKADPTYQRKGGDRLDLIVPNTEYHIPICNSGFGDGYYPVYWGYDANGEVCQIIMNFIDIELAYGDED